MSGWSGACYLLREVRSGKRSSDIRRTKQLLSGWLFRPRSTDFCSSALTEPVARTPTPSVCLSASETSFKAHLRAFALRTRYHFSISVSSHTRSNTCPIMHTKSYFRSRWKSRICDINATPLDWFTETALKTESRLFKNASQRSGPFFFFWCWYQSHTDTDACMKPSRQNTSNSVRSFFFLFCSS